MSEFYYAILGKFEKIQKSRLKQIEMEKLN